MEAPVGRIADALGEAASVELVAGVPYDLRTHEMDQGYSWWRPSWAAAGPYPAVRVPFVPGHSSSTSRRIAMYTSFAGSATAFGMRRLARADLAVVYGSPATAAIPALVARRAFGTPYIFVVQDVWPDSVFATGYLDSGVPLRAASRSLASMMSAIYRNASHIVAISPSMADLLVSRGAPRHKVKVIYNWADEGPLNYARPRRDPTQPLRILYAGNLGAAQGLDAVIDAMRLISAGSASLQLLGGGAEEGSLHRRAQGMANVEFLGQVSQQDVESFMARADVHLVSLRHDPLFAVTVPSKLQALLRAGAPILAVARGEVTRLVRSAGAGLVCEDPNPSAIAAVIEEAAGLSDAELSDAGEAGRVFYQGRMRRAIGFQAFRGVLEATVRSGRSD